MHTFSHGTTRFNFNSDYSGLVYIKDEDGMQVDVPFEDLLAFVAQYKRSILFERLEQASDKDIVFG